MTDHGVMLPPDLQDLKIASARLADANGQDQATARAIGWKQQRLSECCRENTDRFLPIHRVAAMEDRTRGLPGHPHVTAALARRQGFVLVKLPDVVATGTDLLLDYARLGGCVGKLGSDVSEALGDGQISRRERAGLMQQLDELIEKAVAMRAIVAVV